ncbi:hypothetical protein GGI12_003172 [Dipsacomyces acuminosporus]|nr:hypothetical protein GGI12_003172 [Dipsacomyces acuminosporus]
MDEARALNSITENEVLDLFGEVSEEEQREIDALNAKRREEHVALLEQDQATLDYQRWRYLNSDKQNYNAPAYSYFETLKGREPINLGPAFTESELQEILDSINAHVAMADWSTQRHSAFPTHDIAVRELPISQMIYSKLEGFLFPRLQACTGIDAKYWAFRDLFIIGYHADRQRALELHTDGCLASLTLLLNSPSEFVGGGTYFKKFDLRVRQNPGDAWVHDANLRHGGIAITEGTRVVMVAFMDTVGGMTDLLPSSKPLERGFS